MEQNELISKQKNSKAIALGRSRAVAQRKAASQRVSGGLPALSFHSLMKHLAGLSKMRTEPASEAAAEFDMFAVPTASQEKAFQLLGTRIP